MAKPKAPVIGQLGLFRPDSAWTPPAELPDLRGRPVVALDCETRDKGLASHLGPGWAMGLGWLAGVSYAAEGVAGYAPVRHPETECMPVENVMRWVYDLAASGTRLVFHNASYDLGWLGTETGRPLPLAEGQLEDTLAGCVMLDEDVDVYKDGAGAFSLDNLCAWQGVPGKDVEMLTEAVRAYGGDWRKPSAELWRLPAKFGGAYAEGDTVATLALWNQIEPQLRAQGVWSAYRTEAELIPMIVAMRRRGIRIDTDLAAQTADGFMRTRDRYLKEMTRTLGRRTQLTVEDLRSPSTKEQLFTAEGIRFPRTPKGKQGSFSADWMETHPHWLPKMIVTTMKFEEAANKFINNYLLSYAHKGRLHAEVHQFRSDEGGTRSHRFSYSQPPLQQMSSPDKDPRDKDKKLIEEMAIGTKIRRCFLPEPGERWAAPDFSGQEVRLTIHFAALCKSAGVQAVVDRFCADPKTDFHSMVAEMTNKPRWQAKVINFGLAYGKGVKSLAAELGVPLEEGKAILDDYHSRMPYIKSLSETCKKLASSRGYIRLIDGARIHYNRWEGAGWLEPEVHAAAIESGHLMTPCSIEVARERCANRDHPWYGKRLVRADTRKSFNNLIQGSAARQTKIAMLRCWREGITPLIQIHDELGFSAKSENEVRQVERIMIEATPLVVPVVVDADVGPSWGDAKLTWATANDKYGALT